MKTKPKLKPVKWYALVVRGKIHEVHRTRKSLFTHSWILQHCVPLIPWDVIPVLITPITPPKRRKSTKR
jgi:hypothetical protein